MSMSMSMRKGCFRLRAFPRARGGRMAFGLGLGVGLGVGAFAGVRPLLGQERALDDAATATAWRAIPSDGVEMRLSREDGALRLDFDFKGHGGYAIAHKPMGLELPANYEFVFDVRGDAPPENLEFKLSDASMYTLPVGLANLVGEHVQDTELMMAGSVLTVLPVMLVFLVLQRYYVQGITAGSLKG